MHILQGQLEMKPVVKLNDVVQEMHLLSDEHRAFLNVKTGELITLSIDELSTAENEGSLEGMPEWEQDLIRKAQDVLFTENYQELPSKFDIHEYAIMKRFCFSVISDELRERLLNSISGRGAFRHFKDTIYEYGIEDDWYAYQEEEFKRIATKWLKRKNIPHEG